MNRLGRNTGRVGMVRAQLTGLATLARLAFAAQLETERVSTSEERDAEATSGGVS